jgi:uncharacterized protein (TIGR03435 family)
MGFRFFVSVCALAAIAMMSTAPIAAQMPNGQPAFEVASIKPAPPPDFSKHVYFGPRGGPGTDDPTLYTCENCNLSGLVSMAYGMPWYRILNQGSLGDRQYTITATVAPGTTEEQFHLMLQNLLVERFKLELHRDKKEMSMFQLVVLKGGPKFKESAAEPPKDVADQSPKMPPDSGRLPARKWTMERFAKWLEGRAEGPVTDATGLKGEYDFVLWWSFDALDNPDAGPGMFTAIQSQLGLKLEPKKGLVDVLVIDHAEKVPTGN